jgi:hypothetical protein
MLTQVFLTLLMLVDNMRSSNRYHQQRKDEEDKQPKGRSWSRWTMWRLFLGVLPVSLAVFTTVGGTLMEMIGVYQSCPCSISATAWLSHNRNNAVLYLASDTVQYRNSAQLWTSCGYGAVGVLGFMTYMAYMIQRDLRTKFEDIAMDLKSRAPASAAVVPGAPTQTYSSTTNANALDDEVSAPATAQPVSATQTQPLST